MRTYIGNQQIVSTGEFEELAFGFEEQALGLDRELFLNPFEPETADERAARLDAAADILADLREQGEHGDEIAAWDALYADALTAVAPLRRVRRVRRSGETGEAA
ncbi:hypothetical protein SLV14_004494 [Streptomyces sp. Je 1-4]|uniref:hypothetical protein n=1 Tax=Streptomyces TaxID=1883 RepID=UPI0021D80FF7|nr:MULTISPECIES: hypothetical protein [unclassified Streptomyces]UYB41705.1 hypothetical protein SLV14_004494 [Streptomyces sp. Je 1-4]UZQ37963.1 hypothetical protein SLV14N_004494 [Streptomyces sp. Je 1-4] [Streptomyces sp. Je 1-4 4N24]UZQ45380.1 hypothetical protein SLV14NA_004494 [Streptomyces sp. Je 1-4] [Streptomyces sp. Je 1-4 4N24_ara]